MDQDNQDEDRQGHHVTNVKAALVASNKMVVDATVKDARKQSSALRSRLLLTFFSFFYKSGWINLCP